jgi:hypothetical protein
MDYNKLDSNHCPVLPGMEEYMVSIPEHKNKSAYHRDLYNLRLLAGLSPANHFGFPCLRGFVPSTISKPLPFHEARALWRKGKRLNGYFVHFYIEDEKFECLRRTPERYLEMLKSADFIISPDFSTYRNFPFPAPLKNAFDNILLGAYYERMGVRVVSNTIWSTPLFYDILFSGQPISGAICVSSNALSLRDKKGIRYWLHGYKEAIKRLKPVLVIRFGKVIPGEETIYSNPVRVAVDNTYVERMRHGR